MLAQLGGTAAGREGASQQTAASHVHVQSLPYRASATETMRGSSARSLSPYPLLALALSPPTPAPRLPSLKAP